MTITELQAKRDEILSQCNIARAGTGDKSVEFTEASRALALIDAEIARVTAGSRPSRCTLATFPSDN